MDWHHLKNTEIEVENIKMTIYDYCKTCRKVWAEDKHKQYDLTVNKHGVYKLVRSRTKELE